MERERQPSFRGHPVQLAALSFAEMWERFSYYVLAAGALALLLRKPVQPLMQG